MIDCPRPHGCLVALALVCESHSAPVVRVGEFPSIDGLWMACFRGVFSTGDAHMRVMVVAIVMIVAIVRVRVRAWGALKVSSYPVLIQSGALTVAR